MSAIIGKKVGMTSFFGASGKNVACTVIQAGPCVVTQVKTLDKDGYEAVQLGYDDAKEKNVSNPMKGHFKKSGTTPKRKLLEFKNLEGEVKLGDVFNVTQFAEGDWVDVVGTSIGQGFQGVVKRHNFSGVGGATHGQHDRLRAPGSMGASSFPSRVWKGKKLAGRTGGARVKVANIQILKVFPEKNLLVVKGAIPGHKGSYVIVEK